MLCCLMFGQQALDGAALVATCAGQIFVRVSQLVLIKRQLRSCELDLCVEAIAITFMRVVSQRGQSLHPFLDGFDPRAGIPDARPEAQRLFGFTRRGLLTRCPQGHVERQIHFMIRDSHRVLCKWLFFRRRCHRQQLLGCVEWQLIYRLLRHGLDALRLA